MRKSSPQVELKMCLVVSHLSLQFFYTVINLQSNNGSTALVIGSIWTGIMHLLLGVLGTFVLKRFPTAFSVGFFLGTLLVLMNQNLLLFATFYSNKYGNVHSNHIFANVGLMLFFVLAFFGLMLYHFKKIIILAAIDTKGFGRTTNKASRDVASSGDYQAHDDV
jgi:hypothetical protein